MFRSVHLVLIALLITVSQPHDLRLFVCSSAIKRLATCMYARARSAEKRNTSSKAPRNVLYDSRVSEAVRYACEK